MSDVQTRSTNTAAAPEHADLSMTLYFARLLSGGQK